MAYTLNKGIGSVVKVLGGVLNTQGGFVDLKPKDNSSERVSAAEQTDTEQTLLVEGAVASDEDRASSIA